MAISTLFKNLDNVYFIKFLFFLLVLHTKLYNYKVGEGGGGGGVAVVMMGKEGYYKNCIYLIKINTISSTMIKVSTMCIEMQ